jgi:hypothetical protein
VRTANQINFGTELKGPVTAVGEGRFTVLDSIPVRTTSTTVYAGFNGTPVTGNVLEVYGYFDTDGDLVATYIELEASTVGAFDGEYRLRGPVVGLDGTSSAYTFTVRGVPISTNGNTELKGTVAEGVSVSVRLDPTLVSGSYLAERLQVRTASYDGVESENEAEVEGYVSEFTPGTSNFKVAGYPVELASGVVYEAPYTASDLDNGIRVEVKGSIRSGVLVVALLKFESINDDNGDDNNVSSEFESTGTAACPSCEATTGTFKINGVDVTYDTSNGTVFFDGLNGSTLDGKRVEVKSRGELGATGTTYFATSIKLDSND